LRENAVAKHDRPKLMYAAACAAALFKRAKLRACGRFRCLLAICPAQALSTRNAYQ
jgi:hypothetical protein